MKLSKMKTVLWVLAGVAVLLGAIALYNTVQRGLDSTVLMLLLGLLLGGLIAFSLSKKMSKSDSAVVESSHTIAESLRKVFKVVTAEGHFSEIYNYEETTKLLKFIPSKKKALVIVEAKVLVGYDFEKLKWEIDEDQRTVKLLHFPAPEILSTETDYKYYNIEEQFFNLFSRDDLAKIQQNGKQQVIEAARQSRLPAVAAEQMRTLLVELLQSKNYLLENANLISYTPAPQAASGISSPSS